MLTAPLLSHNAVKELVPGPSYSALRLPNEPTRLGSLYSYQVLDTDPQLVFNNLAQLSAFICGTPMSLVSLIDAERQWFKATAGLLSRLTLV